MRETVLVAACIEYLTLRGFFIWRQNQGALRTEYKGRRSFTRFAGVDGISDIIGMTPAGQFLAVECKIAPNKPTSEQVEFLNRVRTRNGVALLVYTIDELMAATKGI